jgi:excisionase family DNA binding protein
LIGLQEFIKPEKPEFTEDILDINAASQFLKVSKSTLYKLSSNMEIPRFKKGKRLYFKKTELVNWISEGKLKTTKDFEMEMSRHLSQKRRR